MNGKLPLIILDADIVIHLLELELWDKVADLFDVFLASTVVMKEVEYYRSDTTSQSKKYVNLNLDPRVTVLDVSHEELTSFLSSLNELEILSIDDGERETLAAVFHQKQPNLCAVIKERAALRCAVFARMEDRCMSFEKMLSLIHIRPKLHPALGEAAFQRAVDDAKVERIYRT